MNQYLFFGLIAFGLFITFRITEREKKESDSNGGCFFYGFMTLVYESLMLLSFGALVLAGSGLYRNLVHESYQATVVDQVESYSDTDEGGQTLMHTPIVAFIPKGETMTIRAKMDVSSGGEYKIGETHRVIYNPQTGQAYSGALSTILLQSFGLLMGLFMFSFVVIGFCYAFYIPLPFTMADVIKVGFIYTFAPIGVIGMDLGMMYYSFQRIFGGEKADDPLWPLILSLFFSLVLTLTIYHFASQLIKSGKLKELFIR